MLEKEPLAVTDSAQPEHVRWVLREWREVKRARVSVITLVLLAGIAGWWLTRAYYDALYSERIAVLEQRLAAAHEVQPELHSGSETAVITEWGGGALGGCRARVNGEALQKFARDYDVLLVCGVVRDGIDRLADTGITISNRFTIDSRQFLIEMNTSAPMIKAILDLATTVPKPQTLPGQTLQVNVTVWYEVVLIPRDLNVALVHNLSDVERLNGKLLPADERRGTILSTPIG